MSALDGQAAMAVVISPHPDDAVFSLGACAQRYAHVLVIDVFTRSSSHILDSALAPDEVSAIRSQEDSLIGRRYGFEFMSLGFPDTSLRGIEWDDAEQRIDDALVRKVVSKLRGALAERVACLAEADVFVPAAIGLHPDHLAVLAALGNEQCAEVRDKAAHVYVYADLPYAACWQRASTRAHGWLTEGAAHRVAVPPDQKRAMLACYPSQMSGARIESLANQTECFWGPFAAHHPIFAQGGLERVPKTTSLFGMSEWLSLFDGGAASGAGRFDVEVRNARGHLIAVPLVREVHTIAHQNLSLLRHAASFGTDCLEYPGSLQHDADSWRDLVGQLKEGGMADALWLSGIREDAAAYMAVRTRPTGRLLEAVPSLSVLCHPDGFEAWLAVQPRAVRKKMRQSLRNERLLRELADQQETSFVLQTIPATLHLIDALLTLQAARARNVAGLDALGDEPRYRKLLVCAAQKGLLHVVRVGLGPRHASLVLVRFERAQRKVLVLAQGFDGGFSSYAPSFLAFHYLIKLAHGQGFWEIDFLRGSEPYKALICEKSTRMFKYIEPLSQKGVQLEREIIAYVTEFEE